MAISTPSVAQLKRAIQVSEQIEKLKSELQAILGGADGTAAPGKRKYTRKAAVSAAPSSNGNGDAPAEKKGKKRRKGKMSAEGRARIIAAQKARWAKVKKEKGS